MWLRTTYVTRQQSNPLAEKRLKEHEAGWVVLRAGKAIAELDFVRIDPPFYLFKCSVVQGHESELQLLRGSTLRNPDPDILYRNRASPGLCVKDEYFFINAQPDMSAAIRDMRPL